MQGPVQYYYFPSNTGLKDALGGTDEQSHGPPTPVVTGSVMGIAGEMDFPYRLEQKHRLSPRPVEATLDGLHHPRDASRVRGLRKTVRAIP